MAKTFTWIGETTWSRTYGTRAAALLEKGKVYDAADFPPEVLAEWAKTGHIKMSGTAKPATKEE